MTDKIFVELHDDDFPSIIKLDSHTYDARGACELLNAQRDEIAELKKELEFANENLAQTEDERKESAKKDERIKELQREWVL